MVEDIDIWRTANLLLRDHGYEAPVIAAQRRDKLLAEGNLKGLIVWKRIMAAIEALVRIREAGESLN